jgi:hypothetical protein
MSHFIFGRVVSKVKPTGDSYRALALHLVKCAEAAHMHVVVDGDISQDIIRRMLARDHPPGGPAGPCFLLVDSSRDDTSDGLLNPEDPTEAESRIETRIREVGGFGRSVLAWPTMWELWIYVSVGYSPEFQVEHMKIDELPARLMNAYRAQRGWSAIKCVVFG